jgi:hypothetical protein
MRHTISTRKVTIMIVEEVIIGDPTLLICFILYGKAFVGKVSGNLWFLVVFL